MAIGSFSGIGRIVTAIIGLLIMAVIALQFSPNVLMSINGMYMQGQSAAVLTSTGERFTFLSAKDAGTDGAAKTWEKVNNSGPKTTVAITGLGVAATGCTVTAPAGSYYTPEGTLVKLATADTWPATPKCTTELAARSTTGLDIWGLLIQVIGIVLTVGPIGFLSYMGANWVKTAGMAGSMGIAMIIGAVIGVVIIAETLSTLFDPLDALVRLIGGHQLAMFQTGIGAITKELVNFYVIGLAAALIGLGTLYWNNKGMTGNGV